MFKFLSLSVDVAVPDLSAAELGLVDLGVEEHYAVCVSEAAEDHLLALLILDERHAQAVGAVVAVLGGHHLAEVVAASFLKLDGVTQGLKSLQPLSVVHSLKLNICILED